ncbi:MAG TPA: flavin monoamine oxidase family protein [Candidatus Acidoferrum sp.]|nr:flavin monoamine oxidase family protein [Candidatus Acidoferrum sp.]
MNKKDPLRPGALSRRDLLRVLGAGTAAASLPILPEVARADSARTDVVVVGAGFAGLTAARALHRAGKNVAVLEARSRVGGRVKAGQIAGLPVDVGGMWVGPTQTRLLELIKEYGLHLVPELDKGKNILEINKRRFVADGQSMGWDKQTEAEFEGVLKQIDLLCKQLPLAAPWTMPRAEEYDTMSADEWFRTSTKNSLVIETLRGLVRGIFTADAHQISLLFFLFYIRSGDNFDSLASLGGDSAQAWTVQETMHQVAIKMAAELEGKILLETPVRAISQDDSGVVVESVKGSWAANRVIVAVPLPLSVRIHYQPPLPSERDILAQHMPMGSVIKYWVAYQKPFWRDTGFNGIVLSTDPPSNLVCADLTPPSGTPGLLIGFMEGSNAMKWTGHPIEERKKAIVDRLVSFFGPPAAHPIDYEDQDWPSDPWSRGCYVASMAPGIMTTVGKTIRQPFGRIHWAGTETSERWMGYIDGAIRSGDRAAAEILALSK